MLVDMMKKAQDVSRNEAKYVKTAFRRIEDVIEHTEKRNAGLLNEKQLADYDRHHKFLINELFKALFQLSSYEITYEVFEKYVEDEAYLGVLREAYETNAEWFTAKSFFRIDKDRFVTKRSAKKDFEDYVKGIKNEKNLVFRIIFSKVLNEKAEEAVYKLRDFLVNDFDELIDKIEPLRQEYIISRKGNVRYEEVNEYLAPIVDSYDVENYYMDYAFYELFLLHRTNSPFVYHPDLKF